MTDLPANLNMAGLLAFLHKTYGAEPLKQTLRQINELNRYGTVFSLERQQETIKELRSMGLDAVATTVEAVLPHEWELPCPLPALALPHLVEEWHTEMAEKKRKHELSNSPQVS